MYEYEMLNIKTKVKEIYYGYNDDNVYIRNNINKDEWKILMKDYVS